MKIDIDKLVCSFMEHCESAMKCGGLTSKWRHDKFRFANILLNEQGLEFRGGAIVPSGDGAGRQGTCGDEGNGKILVPVCDGHGNVTGAVEYGDLLMAGADAVAKACACIQKQGGEDPVNKTVNIDEVCEWLRKHAKSYVNGEYNEFHHCVEYDGTIDVDAMIERMKHDFK